MPLIVRTLRLGAAALALAALSACDSVEERVQRHYERGMALVEEGDQTKAALEFRNAARLDENHAPTRYQLGRIFEAEGDLRAALSNYRLAAELDPSLVDANLRAAELLLLGSQFEPAAVLVDAALAVEPGNRNGRVMRAQLLRRGGDAEEARRIVDAVLSEEPEQQAANLFVVAALVESGDVDAALARIGAMIERDPENLTLELLRLQVLSRAEDRAPLIAALRSAAERFPERIEFRQTLAKELSDAGDAAGAEAVLRQIADGAENHEPSVRLAAFIAATRGVDAARDELEVRLAAAEAGSEAARAFDLALAELDLRGGDFDAGARRLRALIDGEPEPGVANPARTMLARALLARGDRAEAKVLVDETLSRDEAFVDGLKLRAEMQIDEESLEEAIATLRRAIDVAPDDIGLIVLEARAQQRLGNTAIAGERLGRATRLANFDPQIVRLYAQHLIGTDQLTAAEGILDESARRNPGNVAILTALADVRVRLEDWTGADNVARRLRTIEGGDDAARQIDAARLFGEGRPEESIALLETLADEQVGGIATISRLVGAWLAAGEPERAEAYLDGRLAEDPDQQALRLLRAELHLRRGDVDAARAAVERVVAERPEAEAGHLALTRLLMVVGDLDDALTVARAGVERIPAAGNLRALLAVLLERDGDWEGAIQQYAALYRAAPDSMVFANNYASLLAEHRADDPESIALAARIAERFREAEQPELLDTYGWIQFLSGDSNAALRALVPAAERLPNNALVQYHAGRAFAAAGRNDEARRHLEAALSIDPGFVKAASAREALAGLSEASQ